MELGLSHWCLRRAVTLASILCSRVMLLNPVGTLLSSVFCAFRVEKAPLFLGVQSVPFFFYELPKSACSAAPPS